VNKPPFLSPSGTALPFDIFTDEAPVILWVCDRNKLCHYLNKKWYQFTGSPAGSDLGEKWLMKIHTDDRMKFALDFDLASSGKSPFNYYCRLQTSDGNHEWVSGSANPINDGHGHFAGYVGSFLVNSQQSITREKTEMSKAESHLAERILDSTYSMITVVDTQLRYITYNRTTEEYSGIKREDVLGKYMFDVFPSLKHTHVEANVMRALKGETVKTPPAESILRKGRYFETLYIPLVITPGQVDGVIIKVHDRTEQLMTANELIRSNQKLAEQNIELKRQTDFSETILDSMIDVIAVFDKEYRYITINRMALERYGYDREKIIGKHILEVFPSVKDSGMLRDIKRAMSGELVYDLAYSSKILSRTFQNYYIPLKDEMNNVYAVMVVGHDITELIKANENERLSHDVLAQKNKELERSNLELEQFAYVASHDLQEPVRKIATYTNKLLTRGKETFNEETATYLTRINNATNRMYELINGLLTYSRVTREGNLFEATAVDQILKQVLTDFELKIVQKKAKIQYNRLPEIEAVPVQINQMFSNLISNSLKFCKPDVTPVIQISSSDLDDDQKEFYKLHPKAKYVNIFYLDNGIGFEQQYADKIFELFQRLHHRHLYEGSGIGLSICKKIVANHNGLIYAFSEPDKGVTFQIILPYSQKHVALNARS
jgi:PAS domain S-box-containing protein